MALYGDEVGGDKAKEAVAKISKYAPAVFDQKAEAAPVAGGWSGTFHCGCLVGNLLEGYSQWAVATGQTRMADYTWAANATWCAQHLLPWRWTEIPTSSVYYGEGKTTDRLALPEVARLAQDGMAQFFLNNYRQYATWEYNPEGYG